MQSTFHTYTHLAGEISAEMLKDAHIPWVITGHSERRSLCSESNTTVGQKTQHALEVGLSVRTAALAGVDFEVQWLCGA